jgi:hypothetical protein
MKVYDCFTFFNELDLLEIRLQELWGIVDYFVIAESNLSHTGNPKEYLFESNITRFKPYLEKIRHIKVDDMPDTTNAWVRENFQRNSLSRGLYDSTSDDLIIISDLDEIPRSEMIEIIKHDTNKYDRYILNIPQFRHRINFMKVQEAHKYPNIIITRQSVFTSSQQEREYTFYWNKKPDDSVTLEHGGWHFTWLGNDDEIKNKIRNYAHTEHNTDIILNAVDVNKHLQERKSFFNETESFEIVKVDDYFPKYLLDNLDRYANFIVPNGKVSVTDIYTE